MARNKKAAALTRSGLPGDYAAFLESVTNFTRTLPEPQSDLAQQALKDPYLFDFLTLHDDAIERDLETALVDHIQSVLFQHPPNLKRFF